MTPNGDSDDCPNLEDCGVAEQVRRLTNAILEVKQDIGALTAEVAGARREMGEVKAEVASLRVEARAARKSAEDSGSYNMRAIELAAEAKGLAEGKRASDSIPPLIRPIVVIFTKVGSHVAKDGLKHGLTIVGTLLAAYLAHHFGWLGWLLK